MEAEENDVSYSDNLAILDDSQGDPLHTNPTISIYSLDAVATFHCMRVVGQHGKRKVHILIDNDITHNCIDLNLTRKLGCLLEVLHQ